MGGHHMLGSSRQTHTDGRDRIHKRDGATLAWLERYVQPREAQAT
jgi:hypothetical protein